MENKERNSVANLIWGICALGIVIVALGILGYLLSTPEDEMIQGYVEASEYRVSGKVPGRIEAFLCKEGEMVSKGDTLVLIESPEVMAKLSQANAAHTIASAQNRKAGGSARQELVMTAYEMWQKAKAGLEIAEKSFRRMDALFAKEVVSAQKRDEAEAMYNAAVATEKAAELQYEMARKGAQEEDKLAARAMVDYSDATVSEVKSYLSEISLVAPVSGEVSQIYPKSGELVGQGAPIMTITDLEDMWFTFNIREDLLRGIKMGESVRLVVPALGAEKEYEAKITFIRAMASYATWKATKVTGEFDLKTFEVKAVPVEKIPDLRPGMSVLMPLKEKK